MKYRRPMGPAGLALVILLCSIAGTAEAGTWTNLWSTREQQAQHLLDSKDPAAAAPLFSDPRRRAYAEMEAGQYAKAAKSLEPFKDADSEYNRGNALAHSGQLREALSAYDAALTAAPGDKDIIRNRDLVRRALDRQQQNQNGQQSGANGRSGSQGSKGGQSQGGSQSQGGAQSQGAGQSQSGNSSPGSGGQSQSANQRQNGRQPQDANQRQDGSQSQAANQAGGQQGGNQPQNGQPQGTQSRAGQSQGAQSQAARAGQNQQAGQAESRTPRQAANGPGNQRGGHEPASASQASQSQAANQGGQPPSQGAAQTPSGTARPGDNPSGEGAMASNGQQTSGSTSAGGLNADNAQQDADAALRYRQSQQGRAAPGTTPNDTTGRATILGPDGKTRASAEIPPPKPPSEQSLALDQWLRGIPDDSGELLRRKFLIEHRLRQQANEQ